MSPPVLGAQRGDSQSLPNISDGAEPRKREMHETVMYRMGGCICPHAA